MNSLKTAVISLLAATVAVGTGWTALSLLDPSSSTSADDGTTPQQAAGPSAAVPAGGLRFSATVGHSTRQSVLLAAAHSAVVTRPPQAGAVLTEGSLALEVSGRPVRVLAGGVPMSRDLGIGGKGGDVLQLEQALSRLGFRPGDVDGLFDAATAAAVHAWYVDAGHPSPGPSDEDQEKLRALQAEVDSAEEERLDAAEMLETLRRGVEPQDLADAQIAALEAQADVDEARSRHDGPSDAAISLHESEGAVDEARSLWNDAKAAESEARAAEQAAAAAVDRAAVDGAAREADVQAELTDSQNDLMNAENVRRITEEQLRQAEEERQKAKSKSDKKERRQEVERLRAELDEAVSEVARARATVEARARRLETARAATAAAKRETESARQAAAATTQRAVGAVTLAARAVKVAEEGLRLNRLKTQRDARVTARELQSAEEGLRLARVKLDALRQPAQTGAAEQRLAWATRRAEAAQRELTEVTGDVGIVVPAGEVLFLPNLPVRVDEVLVDRAAAVDGEVMRVTSTNLTAEATVDPDVAEQVKVAAPATFASSELRIRGTGRALEVRRLSDHDGQEDFRVVVALDGAPPDLVGKEVDIVLTPKQ